MEDICYGQPNIYFLFTAMSLFNLNNDGEIVYIITYSWTSGAYFTKFSKYFLKFRKITDIHLFISRNNVFDKEQILQETMIIKLRKTDKTPSNINITSSIDSEDFDKNTKLTVLYDVIVSGLEKYIYLVTNKDEIDVLRKVNSSS
jgi:adenine-specific DNA-methyltransferase